MARRAVLVAGTHSGCGKTTVMLALLQTLRADGVDVIAFKAGPDFIDPVWHQAASGQVSENLDTQMMGEALCRHRFHARAGEFSCIEGVMGLFDGRGGLGGEGSSAHLAALLGVPIWLVVDASGMSSSIAAVVAGYAGYAERMGCRITGVIANRVGSQGHADMLRETLSEQQLPPLLAWLDADAPALPERHLGLTLPDENPVPDLATHWHGEPEALYQQAAGVASQTVDPPQPAAQRLAGRRIAVARDAACCFLYPANIEWLRAEGAEVQFFSPLAGEPVPDGIDALWLPGGYPELYGGQLADSATWPSLRRFAERGLPILAECGGMMLLGEALEDGAGDRWAMAGVLPIVTRMEPRLAALGYRESAAGTQGHEFHYSSRHGGEALAPAFAVPRGDAGVRWRGVRASYVHWYFPGSPDEVAAWLRGSSS